MMAIFNPAGSGSQNCVFSLWIPGLTLSTSLRILDKPIILKLQNPTKQSKSVFWLDIHKTLTAEYTTCGVNGAIKLITEKTIGILAFSPIHCAWGANSTTFL